MPVANDHSSSVALGNVDADDDLDLVVGNYGPDPDRLYLNLQRQLHAPGALQLGQSYTLDAYLRYGPPSAADLAAVYLSSAPASIALPPFGTLGIEPTVATPFPTLIIPQPAGVGSVGFTVPNAPVLMGQAVYSQAMLVAYPNDLRLSNVVRDVRGAGLLRRSPDQPNHTTATIPAMRPLTIEREQAFQTAIQNQRCHVSEPEGDRPEPLEQPFVKGLMQEAKSELRTSFRWAVWGAGLGAIALGGAGLWYLGTKGLVYGAVIGAVTGGVGAWLLYVNLATDA